jgi:hypothetical protein
MVRRPRKMKTIQFVTIKNLVKHFKSLGFFVYAKSEKSISVSVHVTSKDGFTPDFDTVDATFTGNTPAEIYAEYDAWIRNPKFWINKNRVAVINNHHSDYDFDLTGEVLKLGFKYVEVDHEDSNFSELLVKYCYTEEGDDTFRFDGEMFIEGIGDKFDTLNHLKSWISEHPEFKPTYSRM